MIDELVCVFPRSKYPATDSKSFAGNLPQLDGLARRNGVRILLPVPENRKETYIEIDYANGCDDPTRHAQCSR